VTLVAKNIKKIINFKNFPAKKLGMLIVPKSSKNIASVSIVISINLATFCIMLQKFQLDINYRQIFRNRRKKLTQFHDFKLKYF
jgi:hypothetical protein